MFALEQNARPYQMFFVWSIIGVMVMTRLECTIGLRMTRSIPPRGGRLFEFAIEILFPNLETTRWWVAKDPLLVCFPQELWEFTSLSNSRLLICIRDPLDVIASALEVQKIQKFGHSVDFYVEQVWRSFDGLRTLLEISRGFAQVHAIRYEDYCRDPRGELSRVASWLNEPYAGTISDGHRREVSSTDPYATKLMWKPPSAQHIGIYRDRMELSEQDKFAQLFSGVREDLNYH
jgi:hypothetical protein